MVIGTALIIIFLAGILAFRFSKYFPLKDDDDGFYFTAKPVIKRKRTLKKASEEVKLKKETAKPVKKPKKRGEKV